MTCSTDNVPSCKTSAFIICSPDKDCINTVYEDEIEPLKTMFAQLNIPAEAELVYLHSNLDEVWNKIAAKLDTVDQVIIHWSSHGMPSKEGVEMTIDDTIKDSRFVICDEWRKYLSKLPESKRDRLLLFVSSCYGGYAKLIGDTDTPMYDCVIGPDVDISGEDALYASQIFYFFLYKFHIPLQDAIYYLNTILKRDNCDFSFMYKRGHFQSFIKRVEGNNSEKILRFIEYIINQKDAFHVSRINQPEFLITEDYRELKNTPVTPKLHNPNV